MQRCSICGMRFPRDKDFEEHGIAEHNYTDKESFLLRKVGEEEKARRRSRGPYRKAHAA
jgi:uncharacterized C2H2 Zn-finger protein